MCPAIHTSSRSWLRSSSTHEPSDPPLRIVAQFFRQRKAGEAAPALSHHESPTPKRRGKKSKKHAERAGKGSARPSPSPPRDAASPRPPIRGFRRGGYRPCTAGVLSPATHNETTVHAGPGSGPDPAPAPQRTGRRGQLTGTLMILPQVHLRKPCYDFYFL